jgi:hypothetical protein
MFPARRRWVAAAAAAAISASASGSPATDADTRVHEAASVAIGAAPQPTAAAPIGLQRFTWLACRARYRTAAYVLCDGSGELLEATGSQRPSAASGGPAPKRR